jgi:hypothetical protein
MTLELPGIRPAVVTRSLADSLGPFLRFRHLFRNLYGFVLDPERVAEIESTLPEVRAAFVREIEAFLGWMTGK